MDDVEVDGSGSLAHSCLAVKQVPALPVHQRDKTCLVLLAHHGSSFPAAADRSVCRTGRLIFDGGDMA